MATLILVCMLAAMLGFAAHRASICTVRGVAEILHARTAHMMWSIAKSALWVFALTIPVYLLLPGAARVGGWEFTALASAGGFLFGLGAAVNGACAYSTMTRMVDGDVGLLLAVVGFALGVMLFGALLDLGYLLRPSHAAIPIKGPLAFAVPVVIVLLGFAGYETVRLWRAHRAGEPLRARLLARQYRLSTAALLIGLASAVILVTYGSPGYTTTFQQAVEAVRGARPWPAAERVVLLGAVLAGMALSTWQRRSFRIAARPRAVWLRHLGGGVLMGLGTALAPGGNDALVLYGIPSLSPHALPAFAAMVVGIVLGLTAMRLLFGLEMRVACRDDLYIGDTAAVSRPAAAPATS